MNRKSLLLLFLGVVGSAFFTSCKDQGVSVVTVASINENTPFFSDVIDSNGVVHEDFVNVVFENRPYSTLVITEPGFPFGDFIVKRYRVEWRRVDGGSGVPATYDGATSVSIPSGENVAATLILVPAIQKTVPPLDALVAGTTEYLMVAEFTFWGSEGGSDRESSFRASLSVNFLNSSD
jgi:hypothetical protein